MGQIFSLLDTALHIYSFGLIIYIFMSWFPGARESSFGTILTKICEPYLEPFRKIIPPLGMIDLSPIVAILVIHLARSGLWELYRMIAF
ncbi:YggT family protein [Oceanobacillus limi]|uniref:YggT family protein n=1 Tax=Oceanobacillus limi TaxID=930131 RepID=A0A1I0DE92_9BACI|nr:YggT family protein [Oceanobacillus limi]SET30687.1 YggT family protein [Oceanobacillus limi]